MGIKRIQSLMVSTKWSSPFHNMKARHKRDTSATWATRVQHELHVCDTSAHEWHENDTSATRTILIKTWLKTYIHTPILAIWEMKGYIERNNFFLKTTFWKCLVPMPKCLWKVNHKIELCNRKSYTKNVYTRLYLPMPLFVLA